MEIVITFFLWTKVWSLKYFKLVFCSATVIYRFVIWALYSRTKILELLFCKAGLLRCNCDMVLLKLYLLKDWSHQWHHGNETVVYEAGLKLCDYDYISRETSFNNGSSMLFARGGGVLPYIIYTGMCRPPGSWFWSSWFRTGYPFQRRFLERGIIFRAHESSTFVSRRLKLFKDRLLLNIRFYALTRQPLYSCCTLARSIKNWPISRTGYQF